MDTRVGWAGWATLEGPSVAWRLGGLGWLGWLVTGWLAWQDGFVLEDWLEERTVIQMLPCSNGWLAGCWLMVAVEGLVDLHRFS